MIVGGGLAGAKAAETLRTEGFDGPVVLVAGEDELPYERPPLSKGYLLGTADRESPRVHPAEWYPQNDVDLRTGVRATHLDPAAHRLTLDTGEELGYAKLLLATGSSARRLPVPGADLDGVRYLRTLRRLRPAAGRPVRRREAGGGRRGRLDRSGGGRGGPAPRQRGDDRRTAAHPAARRPRPGDGRRVRQAAPHERRRPVHRHDGPRLPRRRRAGDVRGHRRARGSPRRPRRRRGRRRPPTSSSPRPPGWRSTTAS